MDRAQNAEIFISALVLKELDGITDKSRMGVTRDIVRNFLILPFSDEVIFLAEKYIAADIIPDTYEEDAIHVAYAVVNEMDCIISWNFTHLVKRNTRHKVNAINELNGYKTIEIIAPIEF